MIRIRFIAACVRARTTGFAMVAVALMLSGNLCLAQSAPQRRVTRSFTQPIEQSVVASSQTGVITLASVREGDRVSAGDTLAVMNRDVLIAERKIAIAKSESTARLDAARSKMEMLQAQKETLENLIQGGHVNRYELEQKVNEYEAAQAEYRAAEDEIQLALLEIERIDAEIDERVLKSPIDGFISVIHKQPGEHVSISEPQYATVVRLDQLKVRFYLDQAMLETLHQDSQVEVMMANEQDTRPATIVFVSPIIDPDSGTGRIEVVLDNSDLQLKSGINCYLVDDSDASSERTAETESQLESRKR